MHLAGVFARHLYPSLHRVVKGNCPSLPFVEECLRVTGLVHDVGHGPFGHFFDEHFLDAHHLTHEDLGQRIIRDRLGPIMSQIRRSPNGEFASTERLDPNQIAFLIKKDGSPGDGQPAWLRLLWPLACGIFTFDNMDYVSRDAYMCGVSTGPVDRDRLIHYTFFSPKGLTIHRAGNAALTMFLNARLYLYTNVYYHRTTRAIDLHLKEIFRETIELVCPGNPLDHLDDYLRLTDRSLLEEVERWRGTDGQKGELGKEWRRILSRDLKWKMAYEKLLPFPPMKAGLALIRREEWKQRMREILPKGKRDLPFEVDLALQDPRPENPFAMGGKQIYVFDPATGKIETESLPELFEFIPAKVVQFRVFSTDHASDGLLAKLAEKSLGWIHPSIPTSV